MKYLRRLSSQALNAVQKEPQTKLVKMMQSAIKTSGPISVAHYMQQCLTFPNDGYYMDKDVFGKSGDFITSPEISQLFGEALGAWFLSLQLHKVGDLQFIELGPGRGTLLTDMLRTWRQFPSAFKALKQIDLVEASPHLRQKQLETLNKFSKVNNVRMMDDQIPLEAILESGQRVNWHDDIESTKSDYIPLFLAHEFFDALPVFQFQKMKTGWHEILVDIDDSSESSCHFRPVLSPKPTSPSQFLPPSLTSTHSLLSSAPISSIFESSPPSFHVLAHIQSRIKARDSGVALIVDYQSSNPHHPGCEKYWKNSVRGIKNHNFISPFSYPGQTDLSADVRFDILDDFIQHPPSQTGTSKNDRIATLGPTRQDDFLDNCGTGVRLHRLLSSPSLSLQNRKDLTSGYERLREMGSSYYMYAVLSKWLVSECKDVQLAFNNRAEKNKTK